MSLTARRRLNRRGPGPLARLGSRIGYRARTLGAAAALALLAVLLTSVYVQGYERRVRAGVADTEVLVAARDIPTGTPGSKLAAHGFLETRTVPRDAVVPGAIADTGDVARLVSRQPIYAGEQVTIRRFESAVQQGVRGQLSGTLRAQRVAGDPNQLLAGLIRDGDRVDVVATIPPTAGAPGASRIILRDLLVLQAPSEDVTAKTTQSASAVLALTDRQAQRLFYAMKNGQWSLLLRPVHGAESAAPADTAASVLRGSGD